MDNDRDERLRETWSVRAVPVCYALRVGRTVRDFAGDPHGACGAWQDAFLAAAAIRLGLQRGRLWIDFRRALRWKIRPAPAAAPDRASCRALALARRLGSGTRQ